MPQAVDKTSLSNAMTISQWESSSSRTTSVQAPVNRELRSRWRLVTVVLVPSRSEAVVGIESVVEPR